MHWTVRTVTSSRDLPWLLGTAKSVAATLMQSSNYHPLDGSLRLGYTGFWTGANIPQAFRNSREKPSKTASTKRLHPGKSGRKNWDQLEVLPGARRWIKSARLYNLVQGAENHGSNLGRIPARLLNGIPRRGVYQRHEKSTRHFQRVPKSSHDTADDLPSSLNLFRQIFPPFVRTGKPGVCKLA